MKVIWQSENNNPLEIPDGVDGAALMKGDEVEVGGLRYYNRRTLTVVSRRWHLAAKERCLIVFLSETPGRYV